MSKLWDRLLFGLKSLSRLFPEALPDKSSKCAADKRCSDEDINKFQSFTADKDGRPERTSRIDGGSGKVDADKMDEDEGKTDCQSGKVSCTLLLICSAKNDKDEDESGYNLNKPCSALGNTSASVGSAHLEIGSGADPEKDSGSDDATYELTDPVTAGVFPGHPSGKCDTESDSRIDVASRDAPDSVGHGYNSEAESNCSADDSGGSATTEENCGSAAKKSQDRCPKTFSKILLHIGLGFNVCQI